MLSICLAVSWPKESKASPHVATAVSTAPGEHTMAVQFTMLSICNADNGTPAGRPRAALGLPKPGRGGKGCEHDFTIRPPLGKGTAQGNSRRSHGCEHSSEIRPRLQNSGPYLSTSARQGRVHVARLRAPRAATTASAKPGARARAAHS